MSLSLNSAAADLASLRPEYRDARIMQICDDAIAALGVARGIEEVASIRAAAAAAAEYARMYRAAVQAQNATKTVVFLAEARIGRELKEAQERGEVGAQGRRTDLVREPDEVKPTLSDLGIPRQRAAEMKQLAELGEEAILEAAAAANAADEPLTRADVFNHRAQGTGENEWYTPAEHIKAAREVMGGIDLDPASSEIANLTVGAEQFYSIEDNGLDLSWHGRVWLNPPYAQPWIMRFAEKMVEEVNGGAVTEAIALTHNYTDTAWFHLMAARADAICFTRGRIGFLSPDGKRAAPTQGQAFFYFGPKIAEFAERFSGFGLVMVRYGV